MNAILENSSFPNTCMDIKKQNDNKDNSNQIGSNNKNNIIENQSETNENSSNPLLDISDIIMEKTLFLLYQFIIQNSKNLIVDHQSELLKSNFCESSDIVTIIDSIYFYSKDPTKYENKSGFSISLINLIYKLLEEKFDIDGQNLIISTVERFINHFSI